ncbi:MATE family efflux transporter [Halobacteriovorax marinus]|nr:MATE family efflux transporter [Halobacteriovorax marinus]
MKKELKKIIQLSLPLIFAQIGVVLLGVSDMVMLGHYSDTALKASGLANVWIIGTLMFGIGCSLGVDPIISKLVGQGESERTKVSLITGKALAVAIAVLTGLLWANTGAILGLFDQNAEYAELAHSYALIQIPSLIPFFMYMVFRQYLIARESTMPVALVLLLTNFINIFLNWIFIFGVGPFEEMGLFGAGLSSCLMRAAQYILLCLIILKSKKYRYHWVPYKAKYIDSEMLKKIVLIGLPIGAHLMLEAFGLQVTAFMAGKIGDDDLGAHSILLNLQYLFFILPMAFSLCAATRVGNEIGARSSNIFNVFKATSLLCLILFLCSSLGMFYFGESLVRAYGTSEAIILKARESLFYSSLFLFFYGLQLVGSGFLRGAGLTVITSLSNILSLYVIAIPLAYFLGVSREWGLQGLWAALAIGMVVATCANAILNLRYLFRVKSELSLSH